MKVLEAKLEVVLVVLVDQEVRRLNLVDT